MAEPIAADNSAPSAPEPQPADATATTAATATPAATAHQTPQSKDARAKSSRLLVVLVVLAMTGMGSLMLLASAMRSPAPESNPAAPAEAQNAAAPAVAAASVAVESKMPQDSPATQKWMSSRNPRKAGFGANVVFELAADGDVEVWRKRVRPVLTVRCASRATEVFVVTDAPAAIEGNSNRHTIKMSFDGRDSIEQKWEHSIDHDALFAPDGRAMIRRIAGAKELSFTFAPFNAPPATVRFSVEGLSAQHKAAVRMCGI